MSKVNIRPPAQPLFYVTIDGTSAIDSVALGQLWQGFGWKNLLFDWTAAPGDAKRRVDTAHPTLPIKFMRETQSFTKGPGQTFADICIMPEGVDGSGVDAGNWPSTDKTHNDVQMNAANGFIQGFVMSPRADSTTGAQKLGSGSRVADLVYLSSHGVRTGDMFGEASNSIDEVDPFFILAKAAGQAQKFDGIKWLILSNCNTLVTETHNDWLILMNANTSFRGILGYHGTSVAADASSGADVSFVKQLKTGKSIRAAWRAANTAWGMTDKWVILCHDEAKDDNIQDWNDGKLPPVSFSPSKVLLFDEANQGGVPVVTTQDPFAVFWSKTITGAPVKITPANRYDKGKKIQNGDTLSITVVSAPAAATFSAGTKIELTLVLVREDYGVPIDISKMFSINAVGGASGGVGISSVIATKTLKQIDTWTLTVVGAPTSVILSLTAKDLGFGGTHHNLPLWLKCQFTPTGGGGVPRFDFIHDAAIYLA
jgi:hypothetical protein